MSWLYYRTLASAVQSSCSGSSGHKIGSARTVATQNPDETATESEAEDECEPRGAKPKQIPDSIPADEEDALWGVSGLRSKAVDGLLGDWTTLNEHQILENGTPSSLTKFPGHQNSFDRTIKATLQEINGPRRSRGSKHSISVSERALNGRRSALHTRVRNVSFLSNLQLIGIPVQQYRISSGTALYPLPSRRLRGSIIWRYPRRRWNYCRQTD